MCRIWKWAFAPVAVMAAALIGVSWWLTEPLEAPPPPVKHVRLASPSIPPAPPEAAEAATTSLAWPEGRLDGLAAKRVLLDMLLAASKRLDTVDCYTAQFHKQERIDGKLGCEQCMELKVRNHPFSVYFKFLRPEPGKEVVYAEGRHENKLIAHSTGWSRRLLPRLAVSPTNSLALADNRHPITDVGLANMTHKLIGYRRMDLEDADAITILDCLKGDDGRLLHRSIHTHSHRCPERPFARVEVLYDPDTEIPIQISNFDWPEPGQEGELLLAEHYSYGNLKLNAGLNDLDFDPANPEYAFHR